MYQQAEINKQPSNRKIVAKDVFNIVEHEGMEHAMWVKVGTAFVNRDNSLSVKLDLWPSNYKLVIRDRKEPEHGVSC